MLGRDEDEKPAGGLRVVEEGLEGGLEPALDLDLRLERAAVGLEAAGLEARRELERAREAAAARTPRARA